MTAGTKSRACPATILQPITMDFWPKGMFKILREGTGTVGQLVVGSLAQEKGGLGPESPPWPINGANPYSLTAHS